MSTLTQHLSLSLLLLCLASLPACASSSTLFASTVEGNVVEQGTNKPIPGVIIVARWRETPFSIGHSNTICVHVESAVTDEAGHYRLRGYKGRTPSLLDGYKIGYETPTSHSGAPSINDLVLKPFTGTRGERLEYLSRAAVSCSHVRKIEIKLLPLYRALYEEASSIAVTKEEKTKALHHLKDIEKLEIGSTQAWENFHRREKELK